MRRLVGLVTAALVAAVTAPLLATPAEAAGYRYWSYWQVRDDAWKFSQVGATGNRPADGSVEGWRFAVSAGSSTAPAPRLGSASAFDGVCGSEPVVDGRKRVAVVVDFGVASDAPSGSKPPSTSVHGSCVSLTRTATGLDALVAAGYATRLDGGMVCGIAKYPTTGCGEVVRDQPDEPKPTASSDSGKADGDSTSGGSKGAGNGSGGDQGADPKATTSATGSPTATASRGATASASASGSASAAASEGGIPSAEPLGSISAPALVSGAPATDASGSSDRPLPTLVGIALVVALAAGAGFQIRRRRSA